jgi:hypothetical protein
MAGTFDHLAMRLRRRTALSLALITALWAGCASTAHAQFDRFSFNSEGPAPSIGNGTINMSRDINGQRGSYTGSV